MKPIFKFSVLLTIAGLLAVAPGCKREEADFIGPAYISAPDGFAVTAFTATPSSVDFTSGTVAFNASFTHSVTWILTIRGEVSGAVYETKGIGNGFSNLIWKGTHTGVIFFRKGENAVATLSFYGTSLTASSTVNIVNVRNFAAYGYLPLYGDFENFINASYGPPIVYSPYWAHFNFPNPIPNVEQGADSNLLDYNGNIVPSVQGKQYYYIRGLGNQQVFVSGVQSHSNPPSLPATPDNVWVNMYIYGTGDPNAGVEIEYQEDDIDGDAAGYQGDDDDAFVARITLDHKGWKLFSFQYSKLTPSLNAAFGGSGNKIHEPDRIKSFDLVLVKKTNPNSPIEVYFDFPIITVGGPFDPSN
ncbi:MAG: hypothetical protein K2X86_04150 [Cytophagaceae bacterium]|nr:hypothetical protein [Cytophagaceae bacterium]